LISNQVFPYTICSQTYNDYETGVRPLPHALIPVIPTSGPHQNCPHGYIWDESDPVEEGWRTCDATIYKEGLSMETINRNGQQQRIRGKFKEALRIVTAQSAILELGHVGKYKL